MLVQTADAARLTGLTPNQIREWSGKGRRGIISPDIPPAGPGRHALFAWQTLLVLRVLNVLHADFGVELGAWSNGLRDLREKLDRTAFQRLWHAAAFFESRLSAEIVDEEFQSFANGGVIVPLAPHLKVLASAMAISQQDQLPLLPPMVVSR